LFEAVLDGGTRHGVCGVSGVFDGGVVGEVSPDDGWLVSWPSAGARG